MKPVIPTCAAICLLLHCITASAQTPDPAQSKMPPVIDYGRRAEEQIIPFSPSAEIQPTDSSRPVSDQSSTRTWTLDPQLSDEFGGDSLDPQKWYLKDPTWNGARPAFFSAQNVKVGGGHLSLLAQAAPVPPGLASKGYTDLSTASVKSRRSVLYGYFEARFRAANAAYYSSFWLYRRYQAYQLEIDVAELCGGFQNWPMNAHVISLPDFKADGSQSAMIKLPSGFFDSYHVFGLEWREDFIKYYLDGALVRTLQNLYWHLPMDIVFDNEFRNTCGPFQPPPPSYMPFSVDYVRVWR